MMVEVNGVDEVSATTFKREQILFVKCCYHVLRKGWLYSTYMVVVFRLSGDGMKFCSSTYFACVQSEKTWPY